MIKATTLIALALLIATGDARAQSMEVRRIAEAGDAQAQYQMGVNYWIGEDYEQAAYWLKKAAEQGLVEAADLEKAAEQRLEDTLDLWKQAAEQGYAPISVNLF